MKKWAHKVEHFIDKTIPYLVLVLLVIIIISFFFHETALRYHIQIEKIDMLVVAVFIADLVFKFIRVRKIKKFIRLYWIDILAVFPFYLVVRLVEEVYLVFRLSETVQETQPLIHIWTEVASKEAGMMEKETGKLVREAENFGKFTRSGFAVRFMKPITRIPRMLRILPYYEQTTGHHHPHDPKEKK